MKTLSELTGTHDPAIADLRGWLSEGDNLLRPVASASLAEQSLLALQVSTRAMLGAMVFETGGISAFGGRVRLLGAGGRSLAAGRQPRPGLAGR